MFDINEIKKDLYKSKNMAKFSHYQSGELFYTVEIASGKYQFPIAVTERNKNIMEINKGDVFYVHNKEKNETPEKFEGPLFETSTEVGAFDELKFIDLSDDLGSTPFEAEMRGSELIRWMQMAMKTDSFIKIG